MYCGLCLSVDKQVIKKTTQLEVSVGAILGTFDAAASDERQSQCLGLSSSLLALMCVFGMFKHWYLRTSRRAAALSRSMSAGS